MPCPAMDDFVRIEEICMYFLPSECRIVRTVLPDTVFRYLRATFKTPVMTADEDKRMK